MHPLAAIARVFLAATAYTVTILPMLILLVEARRRPPAEARRAVPGAAVQGSVERAE